MMTSNSRSMLFRCALTVLAASLTGCATEPLVVGEPSAEVPEDQVRVFYVQRPDCEFETIAHLMMENPHFSEQSMLVEMRQQAARLGANGLYVEQTQRLPGRDFVGTARAIRCIK